MDSIRSAPLMVGLVFLAVVFALVALLYAMGTISFMTTHPGAAHHYQHAAVLAVLTVAALVGASLVRPRTV